MIYERNKKNAVKLCCLIFHNPIPQALLASVCCLSLRRGKNTKMEITNSFDYKPRLHWFEDVKFYGAGAIVSLNKAKPSWVDTNLLMDGGF
jgi:hypothetical protein